MIISNKLKTVLIKDIKPYKKNPKIHTPEQIALIKKSIETNSYVQPICIGKNNEIVIGHGRYMALKEMGVKEIEVVDVSDLSIEQIKKLRIADNQISKVSGWDKENLKFELKTIYNDIDLGVEDMIDTLGFSESFADEMVRMDEEPKEPEPKSEKDPEVSSGKVKHKYICKHCDAELVCPNNCEDGE
jgi:ParB-like chromosome segregation protein Spo0J